MYHVFLSNVKCIEFIIVFIMVKVILKNKKCMPKLWPWEVDLSIRLSCPPFLRLTFSDYNIFHPRTFVNMKNVISMFCNGNFTNEITSHFLLEISYHHSSHSIFMYIVVLSSFNSLIDFVFYSIIVLSILY
jgi:hypothetical protein